MTSHRIAEGSADSSSLGTAITSQKGAVRRVQPTQSILLSDDPSVVTRTHHPIDEIEEYLGRCADETQARHSAAPAFSLTMLPLLSSAARLCFAWTWQGLEGKQHLTCRLLAKDCCWQCPSRWCWWRGACRPRSGWAALQCSCGSCPGGCARCRST